MAHPYTREYTKEEAGSPRFYRHMCYRCGTISDFESTSEYYCTKCDLIMQKVEAYMLATVNHESGKPLYIPDYNDESTCKFHGHPLIEGKCVEPIHTEPHELEVIQRLSEEYRRVFKQGII